MEATVRLARESLIASCIVLLTYPLGAQERGFYQAWIHANAKECCPHDRCFPVVAAPGAWNRWDVKGYRSAVPLGGERRWPFKVMYGCAYAGSSDTIRCLFVPVPEAS